MAVSSVVTAETVAVNPALVAPAGTVTDPGTVTALLSLDRLTASPPGAAGAERLTVQASLPDPVIELWLQLRAFSVPAAACPVPLKLIVAVLGEALSLTVMLPLALPVAVGPKATERVADCPGFKVTGKVAPDMLKPAPESAAEWMVSGAVPEDVSVTGSGAELVLTVMLPKSRLLVLNCSPAT